MQREGGRMETVERCGKKTTTTFIYGQLDSVAFMFGGEMISCCLCVVQGVKHVARHDPPELQVFIAAHRLPHRV